MASFKLICFRSVHCELALLILTFYIYTYLVVLRQENNLFDLHMWTVSKELTWPIIHLECFLQINLADYLTQF
jgi:hypothetical protein